MRTADADDRDEVRESYHEQLPDQVVSEQRNDEVHVPVIGAVPVRIRRASCRNTQSNWKSVSEHAVRTAIEKSSCRASRFGAFMHSILGADAHGAVWVQVLGFFEGF